MSELCEQDALRPPVARDVMRDKHQDMFGRTQTEQAPTQHQVVFEVERQSNLGIDERGNLLLPAPDQRELERGLLENDRRRPAAGCRKDRPQRSMTLCEELQPSSAALRPPALLAAEARRRVPGIRSGAELLEEPQFSLRGRNRCVLSRPPAE